MADSDTVNSVFSEEEAGPVEAYSNIINFQGSIWELTILFGDLGYRNYGSSGAKPTIEWHTAIRTPWLQAKIACYYMYVNLLIQDRINKINVPDHLIPNKPDESDQSELANAIRKLHAEYFGTPASGDNR